jgi:hypothetical protein
MAKSLSATVRLTLAVAAALIAFQAPAMAKSRYREALIIQCDVGDDDYFGCRATNGGS